MKTSHLFRMTMLVLAAAALTLTGCKKDKNNNSNYDTSSIQQLAVDESNFESAMDETMNDVDQYLSSGNLKSTDNLPCNATVDSTSVVNDTITIHITYNGLNCAGTIFRTGQVVIRKAVGTHWYQQGATVAIRHINFSMTRVATNKTIVINSVKVHKNVSGGVIWQLGNNLTSLVHRTWGHATVTLQDGTTKSWSVARQKTYTGTPPGNLVLTIDGFGSADGFDNLVVWGTNRQGEAFYTQVIEPVVHRQVCGWDPCTGVRKHQIPADSKSATMTFGYDAQNQPVTGTDCPAKFKVDWQKNNNSGTFFMWL